MPSWDSTLETSSNLITFQGPPSPDTITLEVRASPYACAAVGAGVTNIQSIQGPQAPCPKKPGAWGLGSGPVLSVSLPHLHKKMAVSRLV